MEGAGWQWMAVKGSFIHLGQVLMMPQATLGIRSPAHKLAGARIPRIAWTDTQAAGDRLTQS
jgi:hypothetical protein